MHYLYGLKKGADQRRLVATFGSEQQLFGYVNWGTLKSFGEQRGVDQGSAWRAAMLGSIPPNR